LGITSKSTENNVKGIDFKAISDFLSASFIGIMLTINFAGLNLPSSGISIHAYFQWLYS
jgi:hypothetical protein